MIDLKNEKTVGWIQGLVSVFVFIGISEIFGRYCSVEWHVKPVIFSVCMFISGATILIAYGGSGGLVKETIRSIDTWAYGTVIMISYIVGMIMYNYLTSTEVTMLQRISVVLSVFIGWLFLARRPDKWQLLGTFIISVGIAIVAYGVDSKDKAIIFGLSFVLGLVQALRVFIAELHRPHAKAVKMKNDPKAKARVIGFIMLIVSCIFLTGGFFMALMQSIGGAVVNERLPVLGDFMHTPSILLGLLAGMVLMTPLRMLEFSITRKIKAENFMMLLTFMTVSTLMWEWATQSITGLDIRTLSGNDLIAVLFITAGGLVTSVSRQFVKKKDKDILSEYLKADSQNIDRVDETREIIANTLEHFSSDIEKTAKALKIPSEVILTVLEDKDKILSMKKGKIRFLARNYRKNVANADALTGLLNRSGFMTELKAATFESDKLSLFFIDLNKFKPVNDKYGHDAGDYVLQETAKRLQSLFGDSSIATRLGGDEFCILLIGEDKQQAEEKIKDITNALEQEINYKGKKINISGSIGLASFPEDTTSTEELMKLADQQMYVDKRER